MALFTEHSSTLETPSDKNQDFVSTCKTSNGDLWYMVFDGHGKDTVINYLRKLDFLNIMEKKNPVEEIDSCIKKLDDTFNSGSTMSLVKITPYKISCYWRGDSTIKVWENKNVIFESESHNSSNESEHSRMCLRGIATNDGWAIKVLNETTLTMEPSKYYILEHQIDNNGKQKVDALNMTNCLGHNNKTGGHIHEKHIELYPDKSYDVITASDGFWDMTCDKDDVLRYSDAIELTKFVKQRWEQEWIYTFPGSEDRKNTIPGRDDIGIAKWSGNVVHLD
tara:strand:- start:312 stop:1148 length:837 start_codon:yes stop_codon:yes gene_type:complete